MIAPVSTIASSTSSRRARAASGFENGSSREGDCGSPARSAASASVSFAAGFREVRARGGLGAVGAVPEGDAVEVAGEDPLLRPLAVELHREAALRQLAGVRPLVAEVERTRELLRDRRAALDDVPLTGVRDERADRAAVVDALVLEEPPVSIATTAFCSHGEIRSSGTGRFATSGAIVAITVPSRPWTTVLRPSSRASSASGSHDTKKNGPRAATSAARTPPATRNATSVPVSHGRRRAQANRRRLPLTPRQRPAPRAGCARTRESLERGSKFSPTAVSFLVHGEKRQRDTGWRAARQRPLGRPRLEAHAALVQSAPQAATFNAPISRRIASRSRPADSSWRTRSRVIPSSRPIDSSDIGSRSPSRP